MVRLPPSIRRISGGRTALPLAAVIIAGTAILPAAVMFAVSYALQGWKWSLLLAFGAAMATAGLVTFLRLYVGHLRHRATRSLPQPVDEVSVDVTHGATATVRTHFVAGAGYVRLGDVVIWARALDPDARYEPPMPCRVVRVDTDGPVPTCLVDVASPPAADHRDDEGKP